MYLLNYNYDMHYLYDAHICTISLSLFKLIKYMKLTIMDFL